MQEVRKGEGEGRSQEGGGEAVQGEEAQVMRFLDTIPYFPGTAAGNLRDKQQ